MKASEARDDLWNLIARTETDRVTSALIDLDTAAFVVTEDTEGGEVEVEWDDDWDNQSFRAEVVRLLQ